MGTWDNPASYRRTCKKKYTVGVHLPLLGTEVFNKFEKSSYVTSSKTPFVCVGTRGEEWVIDGNKLAQTYTLSDGRPITFDTLAKHKSPNGTIPKQNRISVVSRPSTPVWAVWVPVANKFAIPTSWGDVLQVNAPGVQHGGGDYLVCADAGGRPNLADRWVVNGCVFPDTYDMRAFVKR